MIASAPGLRALRSVCRSLPCPRIRPNPLRSRRSCCATPPSRRKDRLPLRRRHLDRQPAGRRSRAAHLQRACGGRSVLFARRRPDRLLRPPARQHRRLRRSCGGRRSPPHHVAPGGQRGSGLVARRQGCPDRQRRRQLSPLPQALPGPRRRLRHARAPAAALRRARLVFARRPVDRL